MRFHPDNQLQGAAGTTPELLRLPLIDDMLATNYAGLAEVTYHQYVAAAVLFLHEAVSLGCDGDTELVVTNADLPLPQHAAAAGRAEQRRIVFLDHETRHMLPAAEVPRRRQIATAVAWLNCCGRGGIVDTAVLRPPRSTKHEHRRDVTIELAIRFKQPETAQLIVPRRYLESAGGLGQ